MRNSIKYLLAMILGGVLVGSILVATGVYAQNDVPDEFETSAPTIVDSTLSIDNIFQYQGQLLKSDGTPVNGLQPMVFRLYQDAFGGSSVWDETKQVNVVNGWFTTALGDVVAIDDGILKGQNLWLGVQVGGDAETTPRQPIRPAMFAANARMLNGKTSDNYLEVRSGSTIAYGVVNEHGGRVSGWHFTSGKFVDGHKYEIPLENVSYHYDKFTTVVTPLEGEDCPGATVATTSSSTDGKLVVYLHELNGNFRQCDFSFITIQNKTD